MKPDKRPPLAQQQPFVTAEPLRPLAPHPDPVVVRSVVLRRPFEGHTRYGVPGTGQPGQAIHIVLLAGGATGYARITLAGDIEHGVRTLYAPVDEALV